MQRKSQTVLNTLATHLWEDVTAQQPTWVCADGLAVKGKQKLQCPVSWHAIFVSNPESSLETSPQGESVFTFSACALNGIPWLPRTLYL